jgi:hypothetical protein
MRLNTPKAVVALCVSVLLSSHGQAADNAIPDIEKIVTQVIQPMMPRHSIPGMAVGIVTGRHSHVYNFGVMSKANGKPVTSDTLFEVGSVSKTFTVTLASYAQAGGHLSLSDNASKHLPALRGNSFDNVSLLNLGTHTSGGLPLQVPDDVKDDDQLMQYFRDWKPTYAPGTFRTYANPSIGMLHDCGEKPERRLRRPHGTSGVSGARPPAHLPPRAGRRDDALRAGATPKRTYLPGWPQAYSLRRPTASERPLVTCCASSRTTWVWYQSRAIFRAPSPLP